MKPQRAISNEDNFLGLSSPKGKFLFTLIITAIHMLLTVLLFLFSFSVVMSFSSRDQPLPFAGEILYRISQIFQWPLIVPLGRIEFLQEALPVYSGIFILLLNSLVWALAALVIVLGALKILPDKENRLHLR